MKNKKTRRFKIRYIVFGLLGVMALAALVFMRFGGFGTGENVNPEEFLAYAEPVENITVPESAKIIALGEATHGNAEFQQLKLEVFKQLVKKNGVRAFALEGDYGGCETDIYTAVRGQHRKQPQRLDFPFIERKRWQKSSLICVSTMKVHWRAKTFAFTVLICRGFLTA